MQNKKKWMLCHKYTLLSWIHPLLLSTCFVLFSISSAFFLFSSYLCSCICQIIFTNSRGGESESAFTQLLHLSTCALLRHYHFTVLYLHCLSEGNFVFHLNDCNSSSLLCRQSFNIYMINSGYFTIFHIIKIISPIYITLLSISIWGSQGSNQFL